MEIAIYQTYCSFPPNKTFPPWTFHTPRQLSHADDGCQVLEPKPRSRHGYVYRVSFDRRTPASLFATTEKCGPSTLLGRVIRSGLASGVCVCFCVHALNFNFNPVIDKLFPKFYCMR